MANDDKVAGEILGTPGLPVHTIDVRTTHDATLLRDALRGRIEDLTKLVKQNTDNGYLKQAGEVRMDIDRLEAEFLKELEPQTQFSFGPTSPLDAAQLIVSTALGKLVKDRELRDKITTNCAYPIAAAVRHAIILGYQAGNAGAAATVEALVLHAFERTLAEPVAE